MEQSMQYNELYIPSNPNQRKTIHAWIEQLLFSLDTHSNLKANNYESGIHCSKFY